MGIKGLTKLLAENAPKALKEQKFKSYFGREIAIDASMSVYQFLIVLGRHGTQMLTNEAGEVTSHLQGMFSRTIRLLEAGIKPVYVFDGIPPDLKKQELANRILKRDDATNNLNKALKTGIMEDIEKYSKRTVKQFGFTQATEQHYEDCKRLLRLMGVPVVEAPCEAEAQCSALCKADKVYAVASEDMDTLAFGAPLFLRHLMDSSSKKIPVMEFKLSKVLEEMNLTRDQFIDLCILSGCDYCDSIRERYRVPDDWAYQESRRLFKEPSVLTDGDQLDLKWTDPDEEVIDTGLIRFLVNENAFDRERITKAIEKIKTAKNKSSSDWYGPIERENLVFYDYIALFFKLNYVNRSESFCKPVVRGLTSAERVGLIPSVYCKVHFIQAIVKWSFVRLV
ncbi:Elongation of fatty acids protein 2 [Orobanche gracilis]